LLFIDLDYSDFTSKKSLQIALNKILKNIKKLDNNNAPPTVFWSGNGYHIIIPVYCPTELEHIQEFQEFDNPSERFLRFAKDILSNNRADKSNNPSFRSCLLRIPNSFNSKCLAKGKSLENSKVKIIQECIPTDTYYFVLSSLKLKNIINYIHKIFLRFLNMKLLNGSFIIFLM
jgi:hypothetical protein